MGPNYERLAAALHEQPAAVLDRWLSAYARSPMRMPRPVEAAPLAQLVSGVLESLGEALAPGRTDARPQLRPGSGEVREVEKAIAFVGASLGASGASTFDVAALVLALREVLGPEVDGEAERELSAFVEWLAVVAAESLASARERSAFERLREELEDGTPVVLVAPELPAAFFVARPDAEVLRSVFGRLLLTVVRTGARAVLLDASGLATASRDAFVDALARFAAHDKVAGRVELVVVGVPEPLHESWTDRAGVPLAFESHFEDAVARGLTASGQRVV